MWRLFSFIKQRVSSFQHVLQNAILLWMKPPLTSLMLGTLVDTTRSKAELLAENALLRQQRLMLSREVNRPAFQKTDRLLLVLLVRMVRFWKEARLLVQPETLLRWHRELFRLFWKHKSSVGTSKPKLSPETISLMKEMRANNRLWEAQRIRGELLKLDSRGSQADSSEVSEAGSPKTTEWTDLEDVPAQSCGRSVGGGGLRLLADTRSLLASAFGLFYD